ncbi:fungal-specific transcription factor domain-containing protein [Hypoxylon sp. FL1150]|nr:fungal-specific transcription factor domain-containing protein [Hypoxylon sp. FL1150]
MFLRAFGFGEASLLICETMQCDGKWPSCSRCLKRSVECRYPRQDGRQPAPKSYVQLLRNRIELLEKVLEIHGIDVNNSIAQLSTAGDDLLSASSDVEALRTSFEGALCLDESTNFDRDGEARYFGPTSGRLEFQTAISTGEESEMSSPASNTLPEPRLRVNRFLEALETESGISEELENHIIDLYFAWEQPWVLVVGEALFKESRQSQGRYFSPLLLNCILAAGSLFSDRLEVRSDPNDPHTAGKIFLEKAEVLLYYDLKWPSITTIQSLTVISTVYCAMGVDVACWTYQGLASRLALDMGLNIDAQILSGPESLSEEEIQARRRLYWGLYCNDKLSASYTGRVCTMLYSQGSVDLPGIPDSNLSFEDLSNGSNSRMGDLTILQRALVSHSRTLEKIMVNLYGPRPALEGLQRTAFAHSCILELRTWFYDLPTELKIDRSDTNRLPQVYTLHMVYHTGFILLMKPFLKPPSPSNNETKEHSMIREKAIEVCYEAATQICLVSRKYRQVFGSFRLSPITATHCTLSAALIFLRLQTPEHARMSYYHGLDTCLKNLEELSTSWIPAGRYCRNLKDLLKTDTRMRTESCSTPAQTATSGDAMPPASTAGGSQDVHSVSSWLASTDHSVPQTGPGEVDDAFTLSQEDLDRSFWQNIENDVMFDDLPEDYFNFNTLVGGFEDDAARASYTEDGGF